jgi:Flp pilus assembly protein TadG
MRSFQTSTSVAKRFAEDRRGNFAILTGIVLTTVTMAVGMAVNTAQSYHVKSSLRSALDAAVTSTAYDITTGRIKPDDAQANVEKFLNINGRAVFSTQGEYTLLPVVVDTTARTIAATAYANVDLAFPFFGMEDPRVTIESAALYSDKQIEVAMMLDVTGSMAKSGNVNKIQDLKDAAENAVEELLKDQDPAKPRVRVALIPYASGVNTGDLSANVFFERKGDLDIPPAQGSAIIKAATGKTELPSYATYRKIVADAYPAPSGTKCASERKLLDGTADRSSDAPDTVRKNKSGEDYYAMVNSDNAMTAGGTSVCPAAPIIPLTADAGALLESIGDFKASGYTGGAIGIQWTYYMLSSKWRDVIKDAGLGTGPSPANSKRLAKVAILMTDGQFNTAYAGVSSDYNKQGNLARSNAEAICANMRNDGIEIFTIGFDLNNPKMSASERDAAKSVLKNCASKEPIGTKHYFEATTGEELDAAFQAIIANTEKIALTK